MSWEAFLFFFFFHRLKESACHFCGRSFWAHIWTDSLKLNAYQMHDYPEQDTQSAQTCTHTFTRVVVRGNWSPWIHGGVGTGRGGIGWLILTAWPCLAYCQCWASSHWLGWPPINQGRLLSRWTATSPLVAAQGGGKKPHPSFFFFQLSLCCHPLCVLACVYFI